MACVCWIATARALTVLPAKFGPRRVLCVFANPTLRPGQLVVRDTDETPWPDVLRSRDQFLPRAGPGERVDSFADVAAALAAALAAAADRGLRVDFAYLETSIPNAFGCQSARGVFSGGAADWPALAARWRAAGAPVFAEAPVYVPLLAEFCWATGGGLIKAFHIVPYRISELDGAFEPAFCLEDWEAEASAERGAPRALAPCFGPAEARVARVLELAHARFLGSAHVRVFITSDLEVLDACFDRPDLADLLYRSLGLLPNAGEIFACFRCYYAALPLAGAKLRAAERASGGAALCAAVACSPSSALLKEAFGVPHFVLATGPAAAFRWRFFPNAVDFPPADRVGALANALAGEFPAAFASAGAAALGLAACLALSRKLAGFEEDAAAYLRAARGRWLDFAHPAFWRQDFAEFAESLGRAFFTDAELATLARLQRARALRTTSRMLELFAVEFAPTFDRLDPDEKARCRRCERWVSTALWEGDACVFCARGYTLARGGLGADDPGRSYFRRCACGALYPALRPAVSAKAFAQSRCWDCAQGVNRALTCRLCCQRFARGNRPDSPEWTCAACAADPGYWERIGTRRALGLAPTWRVLEANAERVARAFGLDAAGWAALDGLAPAPLRPPAAPAPLPLLSYQGKWVRAVYGVPLEDFVAGPR